MKQANRIAQNVFLIVVFYIGTIKSQKLTIKEALNLESTTGIQTVGSTAKFSICVSNTSFTLLWKINNKTVAQCFYDATNPSVSCLNESSTYSPRVTASVMISPCGIKLGMELAKVQPKDTDVPVQLYAFDPFGADMGPPVTLTVVQDCLPVNQTGIDPGDTTGCGFKCTHSFGCLEGYLGNASGVCLDNGLFNLTSKCTAVVCDTDNVSLNCRVEPSHAIRYMETVDFTCSDGVGVLICNGTGILETLSFIYIAASTLSENITSNFVDGSTGLFSVHVTGMNFTIEWIIDGTNVALCRAVNPSNNTCSARNSPYLDRINASVQHSQNIYTTSLKLSNLTPDDDGSVVALQYVIGEPSVPMVSKKTGGTQTLVERRMQIIPGCDQLSSETIDSSSNRCGYMKKCIFGCKPNFEGSATAVCQSNGDYVIEANNCLPVIPEIDIGGWVAIVVCLAILCFIIGVLVGYFCIKKTFGPDGKSSAVSSASQPDHTISL